MGGLYFSLGFRIIAGHLVCGSIKQSKVNPCNLFSNSSAPHIEDLSFLNTCYSFALVLSNTGFHLHGSQQPLSSAP